MNQQKKIIAGQIKPDNLPQLRLADDYAPAESEDVPLIKLGQGSYEKNYEAIEPRLSLIDKIILIVCALAIGLLTILLILT